MKIAVIGSGSTYTPELIEGLIQNRDTLKVTELYLMDIDINKLTIVGGLVVRMIEKAGLACKVTMTEDLDEALTGASYVLAQIRVGRLPARILDEKIPLKYNLIGQETTGIGGFFKALRTIPVIENIAHRMEELCPEAWLINFSNPSGILADMLLNHTKIKSIGLCNVPINMTIDIREKLNLPEAQIDYMGLNHLSWVTSIKDHGKEYIDIALEKQIAGVTMNNMTKTYFDYDVVKMVGAIPCSYLQYFYFRNSKLEKLLHEEKTRGEQCVEIENELLKLYQDASLYEKPEILNSRGGHLYSLAAISLICAIENDSQERHVVNIKNNGTIPFMEDDDVLEIPAIIGKDGAKPVSVDRWDNIHIKNMMRIVKAYEKLTIKAALSGDDNAALNALMLNPLIGDFQAAKACYYEMKEANKPYLSRFFKS